MVAVADFNGKESEKLQDGIWSDIEEPPVDGGMYLYAVVVQGSSHYYFGGYYVSADGSNVALDSILRLQSGCWTWSNVGRINIPRRGHAVILVNETFMVAGGYGNNKNEACQRSNNGQFNCTELSSSLFWYTSYPIVFSVTDNYGNC